MAKPTNIVQAYINHQTGDLYADIGKLNLSLTASGVTVTGTGVTDFVGATADVAGEAGLVPLPASGTQGDLLSGGATFRRVRAGKLAGVDIGDSGSVSVQGDFTSASITSSGGTSTITVVMPSMGNTDYVVSVTLESLGTQELDNDVTLTLVKNLSATGFDIFFEETAAVTQNISMNILVMGF